MGEKRELDKKSISYQGLFKANELYKSIKEWGEENKYDVGEEKHTEIVVEKGKEVKIPLSLDKKASDYVKYSIKVSIEVKELEDVMITKGKAKERLNKGNVTLNMKAIIETDYDNKWNKKPLFMFMKGLHDKFLRKGEIDDFEKELKSDIGKLYDELRAHLNLFKYKA